MTARAPGWPLWAGLSLLLVSAPAVGRAQPAGASPEQSGDAEAEASASEDEDTGPSAADLAAGLVVTKDKEGLAWHLNAGVATYVGQGVFASGKGRSGTVLTQLSVSPSLSVGDLLVFASQGVQVEYTDPDNATGRRVEVFDTTLGVQYPLPIPAIASRLALSGGVRLPVSWQSRAQGSIGGVFAGANLAWSPPVDGLQVVVGLRGQLNSSVASLRATGTVDGPSLEQEAANCLTRPGERSSDACGVVPNVANLSGQLQVSYTRWDVTASLGFGVLSFVSAYSGPQDELTSPNARAGVNARTFSSGTFQLTYPATDFLLVSAGLSSFQPIQTADGKGMRFPFWNTTGVANGFSSVFTGATLLF
ncbi:MAG: hypothetical protein KC933_30400 [Myxococcales bacterium]|nr:hypothetical protein [Myxococcales bacterium]